MATVTLLHRRDAGRVPGSGVDGVAISVGFYTDTVPPATVHLSRELYRDATLEERAQSPELSVYPKDAAAAEAERALIRAYVDRARSAPMHTIEL